MIAPIEMARILSTMTEEEQLAPDSWRKICLKHQEIAKEEAKKLTKWVLNMFEEDKSDRIIFLSGYHDYEHKYIDYPNGEEEDLRDKIKVGCKLGEGITDKPWDADQIELMLKMLNEKPGIVAEMYDSSRYYKNGGKTIIIFAVDRKPN